MPAHRTGTLGAAALSALLLGCLGTGCRLAGKPAPLDDRLRPSVAEAQFSDLAGDPAEEVINGLAKLGVIEGGQGVFAPDGAVRRGEFIGWLVRANDLFFRDQGGKQIPLAPSSELPIFSDVTGTVPVFPYVQGMVDAGYPVALGEQELGYDHNLIREYMVFLRDGVDLGPSAVVTDPAESNPQRVQLRSFLKDADLVTDHFVPAVLADITRGSSIRLAFGKTDTLKPKQAVTRREAALALSQLRGRTWKNALVIPPKLRPLSADEHKALDAKAHEGADEHGH